MKELCVKTGDGDVLDAADRRILRELQRDSSRSTAEIASAVSLSQAACWRRIQRLKAEGYIVREAAMLDRGKLGLRAHIFVQVKLSATGRAHVSEFADAVRAFPEVLECYVLMGQIVRLRLANNGLKNQPFQQQSITERLLVRTAWGRGECSCGPTSCGSARKSSRHRRPAPSPTTIGMVAITRRSQGRNGRVKQPLFSPN